jgi:hypothetical protein
MDLPRKDGARRHRKRGPDERREETRAKARGQAGRSRIQGVASNEPKGAITNIRDVRSAGGTEHRYLVAFTSFAERTLSTATRSDLVRGGCKSP